MKIIEGKFAGKQIQYKEQKGTRVTTDKVRKSVFDVLKGLVDFEGLSIADLFCGSGMYGLESLSRGAKDVLFLDSDKNVVKMLSGTISNFQFPISNQCLILNIQYEKFIKTCGKKFDLIFADPPYYDFDFGKLKDIEKILNAGGIFVLEVSKRTEFGDIRGLELIREKKYGDTIVKFYCKN